MWMPVPKICLQFTPVRARTSRVVHATTLGEPQRTACGKGFRSWVVAFEKLNCEQCKLAIHLDCRKPKAKSKKPSRRKRVA